MRRIFGSNTFPLIALIILNLVIGLIVLPDYGESWDEAQLFTYAERSIRAYGALTDPTLMPVSFVQGDPLNGDHGPAFVMLVVFTRHLAERLGFSGPSVYIDHFLYFLTFQIGIFALYFIARRWMSCWASFGATLLFSTQPLLWGQAFINPKDAPFMSLFLASVASGLWMIDRTKDSKIIQAIPSFWKELTQLEQAKKRQMLFYTVLWLIFSFALFAWGNDLVTALISKAYQDGSNSLLGRAFLQFASQSNQVALADYIKKASRVFQWIGNLFAIFSFGFVGWVLLAIAPGWTRAASRWLGSQLKFLLKAFLSADVWLAAIVLGFSTAIRVVAPLAGVLALLYLFIQRKWSAIPRLMVYAILAIFVMLALWPHLWPAPLDRFLLSIVTGSRYPVDIQSLFAGKLYFSTEIPRSYLPVLLALQLTETTLLLVLLGIFASIKRKLPPDYAGFLLLWFALPFTWLVADRVPLYDNTRHVLFILPPLFLLAGSGLDWLFAKLTSPVFRALVLAIAILPAVLAGAQLHPYEYIYYNQLTGGVAGAFRQYQLDYWCISYREAALYLNQSAPQNARIVPIGPYHLMRFYARPDLQFIDPTTVTSWQDYDYIVVSTRNNQDLDFAQFHTVYSVERAGVPLTVVKKP